MQKVMFLNNQLRNRVEDLEKILPICSVCKKVCINPEADERDRKWVNANQYVLSQKLTHGYCNDCYEKTLKDFPKQKEKFDQEQERVNISA